jgi:hypothetical protein
MTTKVNAIKNVELGGIALLTAIALVGFTTPAKAANSLSQTQNRQTVQKVEEVKPGQSHQNANKNSNSQNKASGIQKVAVYCPWSTSPMCLK